MDSTVTRGVLKQKRGKRLITKWIEKNQWPRYTQATALFA